ncbi:hypothetical protein PoHVEF18_002669 [Penicillium ochrochloron]
MPQGPSTLHDRVSKTSANLKSLNVSNIVALKREINTPSRGQLQQSNNTLPDSAASNALMVSERTRSSSGLEK